MSKYNNRAIGAKYEEIAVKHLESNGYNIVSKNFRCKNGEIDIVAKDGIYLTFIEVKYRSNLRYGYPQEALNTNKIRRITNTAKYYMLKNSISYDTPCRFDVVAIQDEEIKIIKNAFEL